MAGIPMGYLSGGNIPTSVPASSVTIANGQSTLVGSVNLKGGHTYILWGFHTWNADYIASANSSDFFYRLSDSQMLCRVRHTDDSFLAYGGSIITMLYTPTTDEAIGFYIIQNSTAAQTASNIKFNVFQLD